MLDRNNTEYGIRNTSFAIFARTAEAVGATTKRLEKLAILADYLAQLADADLSTACRLFAGNPFPLSDDRTLNVGFSIVSTILIQLSGVSPDEYGRLAVSLGDLGDVAAQILPPQPIVQDAPITLQSAFQSFEEIAATRGAGKKTLLLHNLLSRAMPFEGKYIVKLVTGDMRMGLKESLVEEALARMAGVKVEEIQRVNMLVGDIGETALMARHTRLAEAAIRLFHPLKFMLATPAEGPADLITEARNRGETQVYIEDKYDGVRAQLHKEGSRTQIFSRTLDPVAHRFPEVADALLSIPHDVIFDGEIVAYSQSEGRCLPFSALQKRLGRKTVSHDLLSEVPVACMIFDLLYLDGVALLDEPLSRRQELLSALNPPFPLRKGVGAGPRACPGASRESAPKEGRHGGLPLLPYFPLIEAPTELVSVAQLEAENDIRDIVANPSSSVLRPSSLPSHIDSMFAAARERGNEGLMVKMPGSLYSPGKRGKAWLKVKRALATLDVVVTAVEWGHGKRNKVLSDYTFAVLGEDGSLLNVGKAYSGLTDAEIIELTAWFKAHTIRDFGRARLVEPTLVIEVAFDKIQPSARHKSGYALRFPRIVRLRPDKRPQDASTLAEVRAIAGD